MPGDGCDEESVDGPDHEPAGAEEGDIPMTNPALQSIIREIMEEEGLHELAKNYPAQGYVVPRRSRGWRVSRWKEEGK